MWYSLDARSATSAPSPSRERCSSESSMRASGALRRKTSSHGASTSLSGEKRRELGRLIAQTTIHLSEYMDVLGPERYEEAVALVLVARRCSDC